MRHRGKLRDCGVFCLRRSALGNESLVFVCVFGLCSGSCCGPSSSSSPSVCCSSGSTSGGRRTTTTASSTGEWLSQSQRVDGECAQVKLEPESHQRDSLFIYFLVPNKLDWSTLWLFPDFPNRPFNPPSAFNLSRNHPDYCIITDGSSPTSCFVSDSDE